MISIDPVALSYLLAVTGPVTVDGVTLTADNAVDELLNGTYLRLRGPGGPGRLLPARRPRRLRRGDERTRRPRRSW